MQPPFFLEGKGWVQLWMIYTEKFAFAWFSFLPFSFVLDKQNYAWYGSFYVIMLFEYRSYLSSVKDTACREGNFCSRSRSLCPLRILVGQWGEQIINKDAKTADLVISQYLSHVRYKFKDMFWLVRFKFTWTAHVALKHLSILRPCFVFFGQVQWKIAI